jgi:hypothetical protein
MDTLGPSRCAKRRGARRRPLPDAEIGGVEFSPLLLPSEKAGLRTYASQLCVLRWHPPLWNALRPTAPTQSLSDRTSARPIGSLRINLHSLSEERKLLDSNGAKHQGLHSPVGAILISQPNGSALPIGMLHLLIGVPSGRAASRGPLVWLHGHTVRPCQRGASRGAL